MTPTDTFFNLNEDKKQRIIDAAIKEFSNYAYDESNISNIVREAKIARGSFYQYFDDKEDVYLYIIKLVLNEKIKFLTPVLTEIEKKDFFTVFKELFEAGLQFAINHPEYAKIGDLLIKRPNEQVKAKLYKDQADTSNKLFEFLITKGKEHGEIRKEIDTEFIAQYVLALNTSLVEAFVKQFGYRDREKMDVFVDRLINVIKNGIGQS